MFDVLLRDMNVDVPASGGRRIEVAQDLPRFSGTQLAIDITCDPPTSVGGSDTDSFELVGSQTLTVCQALSFLLKRNCLILDPLISLSIDAR